MRCPEPAGAAYSTATDSSCISRGPLCDRGKRSSKGKGMEENGRKERKKREGKNIPKNIFLVTVSTRKQST